MYKPIKLIKMNSSLAVFLCGGLTYGTVYKYFKMNMIKIKYFVVLKTKIKINDDRLNSFTQTFCKT